MLRPTKEVWCKVSHPALLPPCLQEAFTVRTPYFSFFHRKITARVKAIREKENLRNFYRCRLHPHLPQCSSPGAPLLGARVAEPRHGRPHRGIQVHGRRRCLVSGAWAAAASSWRAGRSGGWFMACRQLTVESQRAGISPTISGLLHCGILHADV
jgi:hypothetical protein